MKSSQESGKSLPVMMFEQQKDWAAWLEENHAGSPGVWLRIARTGAELRSITYGEAIEVGLCYGWIDGQAKSHDEVSWLQKFTRRGAKSIWSKVNREKAVRLIESGQMKVAGLEAVARAKQDGRWDAAYDPPSTMAVPEDFQAELEGNAEAKAFFATLNSRNRYAILFRIQSAKKAETRRKRIVEFVSMLERKEKLYP